MSLDKESNAEEVELAASEYCSATKLLCMLGCVGPRARHYNPTYTWTRLRPQGLLEFMYGLLWDSFEPRDRYRIAFEP